MEFTSVAIPGSSWIGLQDYLAGKGAGEATEDLTDRGFFEGESLSEAAQIMLEGYTQAEGAVQLILSEAGVVREAMMWVNADRVTTVVQADEESVILRRAEPGTLPLLIIELLQFGPRPSPSFDGPLTVDASLIFGLLDGNGRETSEELARVVRVDYPQLENALLENEWRCWMIQSFNVEGEEPVTRDTAFVLDSSAGLFGLDFTGNQVDLVPVAPTDIWLVLSELIAPAT